jgi:hypothetical protein
MGSDQVNHLVFQNDIGEIGFFVLRNAILALKLRL